MNWTVLKWNKLKIVIWHVAMNIEVLNPLLILMLCQQTFSNILHFIQEAKLEPRTFEMAVATIAANPSLTPHLSTLQTF